MRVLLYVDCINWAWAFKANALKKYLPYDVTIKLQSQFNKTDLLNYDAIHFFDWQAAISRSYVSCGISSHNYEFYYLDVAKKRLPKISGITCVSRILYDSLCMRNFKNLYLCMNGVDEEFFIPGVKNSNNKFIVTWVGQKPNKYLPGTEIDIKGYCIANRLKEYFFNYDDVEFIIHENTNTNAVTHTEMISLYHKTDLLLVLAPSEGTPNPAFEAASCGIPIISTSVGCMPELLIDGVNGYLLKSYKTIEESKQVIDLFVEKILYLKNNRELCKIMGFKNRKEIENNWTWKERSKQWIPVFENCSKRINKKDKSG